MVWGEKMTLFTYLFRFKRYYFARCFKKVDRNLVKCGGIFGVLPVLVISLTKCSGMK